MMSLYFVTDQYGPYTALRAVMDRLLFPQALEEGPNLVALEQAWASNVDFRKRDGGNGPGKIGLVQIGWNCLRGHGHLPQHSLLWDG
jgi:hypothetical protein